MTSDRDPVRLGDVLAEMRRKQPGASREDALAAERQVIIAENPAYNIARPKEAR